MRNWIYCGTSKQVGAGETRGLLEDRSAIWCPPMGKSAWPTEPRDGDPLWLVWQREAGSATCPILLLGAGKIVVNSVERFQTPVLFTESDIPGTRDAAIGIGYSGPTSMSFLVLRNRVFPNIGQFPEIKGLGTIRSGLNGCDEVQAAELRKMLNIE